VDATAEWDLILACREGVTGAFEPLVRRHEGPALGFASALLGDEDEAADALQDAFVQAYRALPRLAPGSPFGPWFRAIVRNACLDRLRSPRMTRSAPFDARSLDRATWNEPIAERAVARREISEAIGRALRALPDEQRAAVLLREVEGLSYTEIARTLGIPEGTVGSRLSHARAALRSELMAGGVGLEDVP
jgi:RNA polymerase sigma-70 factor (ECF subfamily)